MIFSTTATGPQPAAVAWAISTNRRVTLIFTDLRLICLKTRSSEQIAETVSEILWGDVQKATVGRISNRLRVSYRAAGSEVFNIDRSEDAAHLRQVVPSLVESATEETAGGRRALCPACFGHVARNEYRCSSCEGVFRHPVSATLLALWLPGAGHFYVRRYAAAVFAIVFELFLLATLSAIWGLHHLGRLQSPRSATLALAILWISWRLATALHVRSAARDLLIDHDRRRKTLDSVRLGHAVRVAAEKLAAVTGTGALVAARAGQALVKEAATQIRGELSTEPAQPASGFTLVADLQTVHDARAADTGSEDCLGDEQRNLVSLVEPAFAPLLERDERVLYATRGAVPYSILDYLSLVILLYFVRRCVYVFTDRRIFVIRVGIDDKPLPTVSAICYGDIVAFRFSGGFGFTVNMKLTLKYPNGRSETFNRIPLADLERIRSLLPEVLPSAPAAPATPDRFRERRHFCCWCGSTLRARVYRCLTCRVGYRNARTARILAILVPGGGYFYAGLPKLGMLDAFVETFLLLNAIGLILGAAYGGGMTYAKSAALLVAILFIEKVVSVRHSVEHIAEFVPAGSAVMVRRPVLRVRLEKSGMGTTFVLAVLGFMLAIGVAARLPLYGVQIDLAKQMKMSTVLRADADRLEKELLAIRAEVQSIDAELKRIERDERWHSYTVDSRLPIRETHFSDSFVDAQYQRSFRKFRDAYARYQELEGRYRDAVHAYNAGVENAIALERRIGATWQSITLLGAARDIGQKISARDVPDM